VHTHSLGALALGPRELSSDVDDRRANHEHAVYGVRELAVPELMPDSWQLIAKNCRDDRM